MMIWSFCQSSCCSVHPHEILQLLLLELFASIRITSVGQINIFNNNILVPIPRQLTHMFIDSSVYLLTECTCGFLVPCEDEALIEFHCSSLLSQLLPVEPDQEHPVSMFLIALLTCGQAHTRIQEFRWTTFCLEKANVLHFHRFVDAQSKGCKAGASYATCPLLLDGRHLLLCEAPVLCESSPVSCLQKLVGQAPGHGAELLGLIAVVEFKRQRILAVNALIKFWVCLKGQFNYIKASESESA